MHFPRLEGAAVKITPIEKGGSDRKFYRVACGGEQVLILVKYNLGREENRHYARIADFFAAHGIRAPRIYFHDAEEGLIWIEDLGARDLWSYRHEPWLVRRAFYESALDAAATLHTLPQPARAEIESDLPTEFDAALYRWEQRYFVENCLSRIFGFDVARVEELAHLPALAEMAERLGALPRVLVHRDFQSQNIIVRNDAAYLIDFQGMRPGLAEYDLASLLYDPYVTLAPAERADLLSYYRNVRQQRRDPLAGDSDEILRLCGIQRLMQALGAYGFLGLVKGNRAFLAHVPAALRTLRALVAETAGLAPLQRALESLPENVAVPE